MPEETKAKSGFAFHCHHDELVEWVEDYEQRVRFITTYKPVDEQELRLRLFQMIPADKLSGELAKLLEARDKVYETYTASIKAANKANIKALEDYDQLWKTCQPEFVKLHEVLCPDCPWDGETIFPT